jgi:perosamine synthetase
VAVEQVKKADRLVAHRRMLCEHLTQRLSKLAGIVPPVVRPGCTHDYLLYCVRYDAAAVGMSKDEFMRRLDAEGIKLTVDDNRHVPPISGFVKPIHLQPIFTRKQFRPKGYPWSCEHYPYDIQYGPGLCPVVEDFWQNSLICINAIYPPLTLADMDDIADAFEKVLSNSR